MIMSPLDYSFMCCIVLTAIILDKRTCHGYLFLVNDLKRHGDAQDACQAGRGRLVLPISKDSNGEVQKFIEEESLTSTWIDARLVATGWQVHNTDDLLLNQGCYKGSSLINRRQEANSKINDCYKFCSQHLDKYSAFQQRDNNSGHCMCLSSVPTRTSLGENKCTHRCQGLGREFCGSETYDSYRVIAINGTNEVPPWDIFQIPPSHSVLCASYYMREMGSQRRHYLLPKDCNQLLTSACMNASGIYNLNTDTTWFEANRMCLDTQAGILTPNASVDRMSAWPENIAYWTGVTSWKWIARETPDYTNWANGHPDLDRGECVAIKRNGQWESASCDLQKSYVCESDNETILRQTTNPDLSLTSSFSSLTSYASSVSSSPSPLTTPALVPVPSDNNSIIGLAVGVSLALIVLLAIILTIALIFRRCNNKKDPIRSVHNPTFDPDNDNIIAGNSFTNQSNNLNIYETQGTSAYVHGTSATNAERQQPHAHDVVLNEPSTAEKTNTNVEELVVENELYGELEQTRVCDSEYNGVISTPESHRIMWETNGTMSQSGVAK